MPETKTAVLPTHKNFIASLNQVAPTMATIAKNPKVMKMPKGVQATVMQYRKLVDWFAAHQAEYEVLAAAQTTGTGGAAKPKTARAAG